MKKRFNGKTYNTDSAVECGVSERMVDVRNGLKTYVIDRVYESRKEGVKFIVTTTFRFKSGNDKEVLTKDDVLISTEKNMSLCDPWERSSC